MIIHFMLVCFRKRRRTNEKMKNIINTIEKEIETQLDVKSEKNDFTTTDTEAILKVCPRVSDYNP